MALTTARTPVTAIDQMANGTTVLDMPSAAGPLDLDIAGADCILFEAAAITVDDVVTMDVNNLTGETFTMDTSGGATAVLNTAASLAKLETTTAHPLELGANSITGLTIATDAKVELDVEGTATNHLVTKAYVDAAASTASAALADMVVNEAINGSFQIPTSTGNDLIVNWGVTASSTGSTAVVFDVANTTATYMALACREITGGAEATANVNTITLTGMNVVNTGSASSPVHWIAIGT